MVAQVIPYDTRKKIERHVLSVAAMNPSRTFDGAVTLAGLEAVLDLKDMGFSAAQQNQAVAMYVQVGRDLAAELQSMHV